MQLIYLILFSVVSLLPNVHALDSVDKFCQKSRPSSFGDYSKEGLDQIMAKYANLKEFASESDLVLSEMVKKNSQFILGWLQKRKIKIEGHEEAIVRQWRLYYFKTYALRPSGVLKMPKAKKLKVKQMLEEIQEIFLPLRVRQSIEAIFKRSKRDMLAFFSKFPQDKKTRAAIQKRIKKIELFTLDKIDPLAKTLQKSIPDFLTWSLAYDPVPNQINLAVKVLEYPNEATIYTVMLHEMAHAIDPCRFPVVIERANPFKKVLECLRKSTGAKLRDDSKMMEMVNYRKIKPEMAEVLKKLKYCNKSFYPPQGMQKDQMSEVFADWLSAEVFARSLFLGRPNYRVDLCEPIELENGSSYIANKKRLATIYFANPVIAKKYAVKAHSAYCAP